MIHPSANPKLAARMSSMPGNSICGPSDGNNWALRTIINKFWGEFEAKVSSSRQVSLAVV
jgi:NADH:ubiquinone oxidoreductase subunit F (NADH-binding)